jgi:hypothetical protein
MLAVAVFLIRLTSALRRRERLTGVLGRLLRAVYPLNIVDRVTLLLTSPFVLHSLSIAYSLIIQLIGW